MATTFTEDAQLSAAENFAVFLAGQEESDYTLGAYTGTEAGDMELYTELKIKVSQEAKEKDDFYKARQAALDAQAATHATERQTLQDEWQVEEDAGSWAYRGI